MFYTIFSHELKYRLSSLSTWITCAVLFFFWFFATMKLGQDPKLWGANGEVYFNAPHIIYILLAIKGFVAYIALPLLMADPIHRDLSTNTGAWLYALPINEQCYFWGRFLGSFVSLALIIVIASLSMLLAPHAAVATGLVEAERVLNFPILYLLDGYVKILLPTIFMSAAIVFSLVILTRKYAAALIATMVLFLGSIIAVQLSQYGRQEWFQLINPTAFHAVHDSTLFWDVEQRNTAFIPFTGILLYNRLLWVGIGLSLLAFTAFRFNFTRYLVGNESPKKEAIGNNDTINATEHALEVHKKPDLLSQIRLLIDQAVFEITTILKEPLFIAIFVLCAIWVMINNMSWQNLQFDSLLPSTSAMINSKRALWMLTFLSLPFMAGTLIYRERSIELDAIVDSTPAPDWIFYGSKLLALTALTFLFPTLVMVGGIMTQILGGYYAIDLSLYLSSLYLIYFPHLLQISLFVFAICVLLNSRIKGFSTSVLLLYFSIFGHESNLFQHEMLLQMYDTRYSYSAFYGYGPYVAKLFWYTLYWLSFSTLIVYLATLFWNRGNNTSFTERLRLAKQRLGRKSATIGLAIASIFVLTSAVILYNQHWLNDYLTEQQQQAKSADYERRYQKLASLPKPSIENVKLHLELYPKQRRADYTATLQLHNSDDRAIDILHLMMREHTIINAIEINGQQLEAQATDPNHGYSSYRLSNPIAKDGTAFLTLSTTLAYAGFSNGRLPEDLVENGSFLDESILPRFNYDSSRELTRKHQRNSQKLPKQLLSPHSEDSFDWNITIGTLAEQTAIAPGQLNRQWQQNGGHYVQYISTAKDQNRLAFISAHYQSKQTEWQGEQQQPAVKIKIYSHPQHQVNVDHIIEASKRALAFLSQYFGSYPYEELRIAETTEIIEDAQTYAGLILIPENKVWNGDYQHDQGTDYVDYIVARAIAKHWWAHQLDNGNVSGVVAEAIPEYLAHQVIEQTYGRELVLSKYIRRNMRRYFFFRAPQSENETAIVSDKEGDEYIHRLKGSLALNALARTIGVKKLNLLLSDFYHANLVKNAPDLSANGLHQYLLSKLPPEDTILLTEYFTKIVDYNQHIVQTEYTPTADGRYLVNLKLHRSRHINKKTASNSEDLIPVEIAIYALTDGKPTQVKSYLWDGKTSEIEIVVMEKPEYAIIDPLRKFLDSDPRNNRAQVRLKRRTSNVIDN